MIIIAIGIIVNLIEISVFARTNVTALLVTNIILVLFFLLFVPFFTKFRKFGEDMQKDKNITASKNSRKNKRTQALFVNRINGGKCFG